MELPSGELVSLLRKERFENLNWSKNERLFQNRLNSTRSRVPFTAMLRRKLRKSCFGTYLEYFNHQQHQNKFLNDNKLGITKWEMKTFDPKDWDLFRLANNLSDDLFGLLLKAIAKENVIDWDFLYRNLVCLRVANGKIDWVDPKVGAFRNLRVLVLSENFISKVDGASLPRKLIFLELFANEIDDLGRLLHKLPPHLMHLGLGRNKLVDGSKLHLVKSHGVLKQVRTLDLSDNDIYDLRAVLIALSSLQFLRSLLLEGNPCSVCQSYKNVTLKYLPQLEYLDNTEILEEDRSSPENNDNDENCTNAAIIFTCHRIIGLPPPPKEKGVQQLFHLEVSLPLLEEVQAEVPANDAVLEEEPKFKEKKEKSKGTQKDKSKASGKKKGFNPYAAEDEHQHEIRGEIKDATFKTTRMPWSKVIQFPEDALVVESPYHDLKDIRDTFRSCVDVKVVYLKILPPQKTKKSKTDKGKNKKGKKEKSNKEKKESVPEKIEPKETILKKVTLARFSCDLQTVNWSDTTVDFYWAAHPKTTPNAAVINGDLRALKYIEGKAKAKKAQKQKGKNSGDQADSKEVSNKTILPTIFTCQVGFGLRRL